MPSFKEDEMSDADVDAVIAYLLAIRSYEADGRLGPIARSSSLSPDRSGC